MAIVVCDTSAIIALNFLGQMELLETFFSQVFIPPAVMLELRSPGFGANSVDVDDFPFLKVQAPSDANRVSELLQTLDPGEASAIALGLELEADFVMLDERSGREMAQRLGLLPLGVLGLLVRAKRRGDFDAIAPMFDRLQTELNFYLSSRTKADILRSVGE